MIVLNVGGNNKEIALPDVFGGWRQHLLDIDPKGKPDICCDSRDLKDATEYHGLYDAVYCSHNLEHYHSFDITKVLEGMRLALSDGGFAYVVVPNLHRIIKRAYANNLELETLFYRTPDGIAIRLGDVMFGWQQQIQTSGEPFYCHKWGFSPRSLAGYMTAAGFSSVDVSESDMDIFVMARK